MEKIQPWLPEEEYRKATGQLRLQVNGVLGKTFNLYGLGDLIPGAADAIVRLAEDFGQRVRGADKEIHVIYRSPYGRNEPDD